MIYDAIIVGGGPAGLSGALALGRAVKRVRLCDSGPRRNAAAEQIHNFVTRDGTPPEQFREAARQQLGSYEKVELSSDRVEEISGSRGAFRVSLSSGQVQARRVLLCTGMVDEMLDVEGFRELWGQAIFQCPYCHGWEVKNRSWGYWARTPQMLHFPLQLRGWSKDVVVFTGGAFELPEEVASRFQAVGVACDQRPIRRLISRDGKLEAIEFTDGSQRACEVLFSHPPQRQVDLVRQLGLALDEDGFVRVDPVTRETSIPGIYAAGDLQSKMQGAIIAAASAAHAAAMLNHELTVELALSGELG
ncbi:MAG TPA: NAD(P)/FAD-dependent oxidoreductase [Polyangiaceae bacterium]|nr:NAD(P)/FAD-dependent oxidoreductase [Polyangiaceae bacterium]